MTVRLFAVYLGGRAPKANTELHDVVFVTGERIEDSYEQLMDKWFGTPVGLHLDSWMPVEIADGHKISLTKFKPPTGKKLFFINVGYYMTKQFGEFHDSAFVVAANAAEAKKRGKTLLQARLPPAAHTDDLHDIDDCLEIKGSGGYYVALEPTTELTMSHPANGYHIVPKDIVKDYLARKKNSAV